MNKDAARKHLRQFDFKGLFLNELGWDDHNEALPLAVDEATVTLKAVAQKRGMVAYVCRGTVCFDPVDDYNDLKTPLWTRV